MSFYVYRNLAELNDMPSDAARDRFYSAFPSRSFARLMEQQRPFRLIGDVENAVLSGLKTFNLLNQSIDGILIDDDPFGSVPALDRLNAIEPHRSEPHNANAVTAHCDRTLDRILSSLFER